MIKIIFIILLSLTIFIPQGFCEEKIKCVDEAKVEGYLKRMEVLELQARARDRRDAMTNFLKLANLTGGWTLLTRSMEESNMMNETEARNLWVNKKNGKTYELMQEITNATNDQDGQVMILYRPHHPNADVPWYAREINEFFEKFERK